MSLKATQFIILLSAVAFGFAPVWGGLAFFASWGLLLVGTASRVRRARRLASEHLEQLGALPDEARAWVLKRPLAYVWPESAQGWGTTWQMAGLLALMGTPFVAVHALTSGRPALLVLIPVLVGLTLLGGWVGLDLKVKDLLNLDRWKGHKALHDAVSTKAALKATVGHWPPERSPDAAP